MTTLPPRKPGRRYRRAVARLERRHRAYIAALNDRAGVPDKVRASLHKPGAMKGAY